MRGIHRILDRLARAASRAAGWPLQSLSPRFRAEVLERLLETMVTETPVPGGTLRFFAPGSILQWRATSVLSKEPEMIQWIEEMRPDSVLWDIGANVGVYSLYAAMHKGASVVAFEPSAVNYHILAKNIQLNGLRDRIAAYCIALSDRSGLGILSIPSSSAGAAQNQFVRAHSPSSKAGAEYGHGMVGFSVDSFIELFDPPFPNYIKIDVDGVEPEILCGARVTMSDPRLQSVMVELSIDDRAQFDEIAAQLGEAGLELVSRGGPQDMVTFRVANYLFERPSQHIRNGLRSGKSSNASL